MNAGGILSTLSDGDLGTTGDQNTAVEYTGFLDVPLSDINTSTASFTLSGLAAAGPPQISFAPLVIQNFVGGTFNLYSPGNSLLLSGTLTNSALTGVMGPPGTGALFTTTFSTVTGGSLQPLIVPGSLTLSMNLSNVNGGTGFSVGGALAPVLNPFVADAAVNIAGDPSDNGGDVPEPATLMFAFVGLAISAACGRRRIG